MPSVFHIAPILRSLHWLPVRQQVMCKTAKTFLSKCIHGVRWSFYRTCIPVDCGKCFALQSALAGCIKLLIVQTSTERLPVGPQCGTVCRDKSCHQRVQTVNVVFYSDFGAVYMCYPDLLTFANVFCKPVIINQSVYYSQGR